VAHAALKAASLPFALIAGMLTSTALTLLVTPTSTNSDQERDRFEARLFRSRPDDDSRR
jgi:hypothetical protein